MKRQRNARSTGTQAVPTAAAYFAHVALEAALKARMLLVCGAETEAEFEKRGNNVALLRSGTAHNLARLAQSAGLRRLLDATGRAPLIEDGVWARMCADDRPYSLRYGTERIDANSAEKEVVRSTILVELSAMPR
jgi:hypothetical protein